MRDGSNARYIGKCYRYRTVDEWKQRLVERTGRFSPAERHRNILRTMEGWISYLDEKGASMPLNRRWDCERHLHVLFRYLSMH
jgi:hypothetical protein